MEKTSNAAGAYASANAENEEMLQKLAEMELPQSLSDSRKTGGAAIANKEEPEIIREPAGSGTPDPHPAVTARQLFRFYATGEKPEWATPLPDATHLLPVLLFPFRSLQKIRHDYPLFVPFPDKDGSLPELPARPLRAVIDELIDKLCPDFPEDEAERFKRQLGKWEATIRTLVEEQGEVPFSTALAFAIRQFRQEATEKQLALLDAFADRVTRTLTEDGLLLPFAPATPLRVLQLVAEIGWRHQTQELQNELEILLTSLANLLITDDRVRAETSGAAAPDRLKATVGKSESEALDFSAFSELIRESHIRESLPPERRLRIEKATKTLREFQRRYFLRAGTTPRKIQFGVNGQLPANVNKLSTFVVPLARRNENAQNLLADIKRRWLAFFKQLYIARLEVENKYRAEKHTGLFANFSVEMLSPKERAMIPPVLLALEAENLPAEDRAGMIELLSGEAPVKMILRTAQIGGSAAGPAFADRLARMALLLNSAFVLQTPAAFAEGMAAAFRRGIAWHGPALFSIFCPEAETGARVPPYLRSAAAAEGRTFPAFCYDPVAGSDWRSRFSLDLTSRPEAVWPQGEWVYLRTDEREVAVQSVFTAADYWSTLPEFSGAFLPIPAEKWGENQVPLGEFLEMSADAAAEKLPFIWMTDAHGVLWRVIPAARVVQLCRKTAEAWRLLRELGGIQNSHVRHLLAAEKERLAEAAAREIAALKEAHAAELSRTAEELTREIVAGIAAGLLQEGTAAALTAPAGGMPAPPSVSQPPTTTEAETASEAPPPPESTDLPEAEEEISLDEPYIDTPLCTSCNECIRKNDRMFAYDANKQAYIKDATAGTFRDLVEAAEKCPVKIIHPGKPKNPDEPGLEELIKRAAKFN